MTTYKAKPEFVLITPLLIILVVFGFIMAYNKAWAGLVVMIIIASVVTHMFLTTYYQVEERVLKVKSGFLFKKIIAIDSIKKIGNAKGLLNSAPSPDRIEINYNKSNSIIISPKDRQGLVKELKKLKPDIEFDLRVV
ncbi:MAG: PH domain-containing protein [Chitinophagaceae bacterium]